jgi:hypothetical protein
MYILCIKFREDSLIINVARPVLLELAELAHSPIYTPYKDKDGLRPVRLMLRVSGDRAAHI